MKIKTKNEKSIGISKLNYRKASNKRSERLLNFSIFRGGVYSRGRLKEGDVC